MPAVKCGPKVTVSKTKLMDVENASIFSQSVYIKILADGSSKLPHTYKSFSRVHMLKHIKINTTMEQTILFKFSSSQQNKELDNARCTHVEKKIASHH